MKMKQLSFLILSIFLFVGCSIDKPQFNSSKTSYMGNLDEIFSKELDKSDKYPYLYTYKQIRWKWLGDLKKRFFNKMKDLCKSKGGYVISRSQFFKKYHLLKSAMLDRCVGQYPNNLNASEIFPYGGGTMPSLYLCVVDKKSIPEVLFTFGADYNTYNYTRIREVVCLPEKDNWNYYFKNANEAYINKLKQLKKKYNKKKSLLNNNGFRRF